jgi:hypothetical protein
MPGGARSNRRGADWLAKKEARLRGRASLTLVPPKNLHHIDGAHQLIQQVNMPLLGGDQLVLD